MSIELSSDVRPTSVGFSSNFHPTSVYWTFVHGLPSVGPASCCPIVMSSYVMRLPSYVLYHTVLRTVLSSCLLIQHLFDFHPTFVQRSFDLHAISVCHGSFPSMHCILQIVHCVRIFLCCVLSQHFRAWDNTMSSDDESTTAQPKPKY